MENLQLIDDKFYLSKHHYKYKEQEQPSADEMWKKIKQDIDILLWAISPVKDKYNENYIVNGLSICESILIDYENIDGYVYKELIETIYKYKDIAKIKLNGYANGGFSYLLMSLWNPNIKLNNEQKKFAVNFAISYSNNPFDERYWILKNPSWTKEEKKELIALLYPDPKEFNEALIEWENIVIGKALNESKILCKDNLYEEFDSITMYKLSYNEILNLLNDETLTQIIMNEIEFLRFMQALKESYSNNENSYSRNKNIKNY